MAIYKFSNAGGFANYTRYNDFLAGNPAVNPDTGSMFPLGEFTLAADQADVTFTNIPQTYTHLQVRYLTRTNSTTANDTNAVAVQFNGDTTSSYATHILYGNGSTALAAAQTSITYLFGGYANSNNYSASNFTANILDILDYRNTNKNKTTRTLCGNDGNGAGWILFPSGLWMKTNAITSIKLYPTVSVFAANSQFALYGVLA